MAEGKHDDKSGIAELQGQIDQLKRALAEVANANVLPTVLQHGFDSVIAELRPLRDLTPQRGSVEPPIAEAAAAMLDAMEGVTLTGDSLKILPVNVPFIGEPRPYPGQPDPYKTDPYRTDPSRTDPYKTDPGKTDPGKTPGQTIQQQPPRGGYRP